MARQPWIPQRIQSQVGVQKGFFFFTRERIGTKDAQRTNVAIVPEGEKNKKQKLIDLLSLSTIQIRFKVGGFAHFRKSCTINEEAFQI